MFIFAPRFERTIKTVKKCQEFVSLQVKKRW